MSRYRLLFFSGLIVSLLFLSENLILSQLSLMADGSYPKVAGWADNTHFLIQNYGNNSELITTSVNIKTGKGIAVTLPATTHESLIESLPDGLSLNPPDVVSENYRAVIFIKDNDLFLFKKGEKELKRLTNDNTPEVNVRFSPDGNKIAYTKNKDLYVFDLVNLKEIRLTRDGNERIYNGYASWVYYEEILGRHSHYAAFWWSPDGSKIAYLRTDETDVPVFTLNRLDEPDGLHGKLEVVPYPKPGDSNPKVRMGIADVASATTVWVKTDYSSDQYIAWPFWTPDSRKLAVQILNRDQNHLQIILAEAVTGNYTTIYDESNKTWVEFREDVYVMKSGSGFLIRSYRSGWENLYHYGWDGRLIKQLTDFNFRVTSVERVDEGRGMVYFYATGPESTDSHLFNVCIDGRNLIRITQGNGTHKVSISPGGDYFIDTWNSVSDPGSIISYDKKGKKLKDIHKFESPASESVKNPGAELVKITTSDGLFKMPALITYPLNFDPSEKYPVVFTIYGGPDYKNVYNRRQPAVPSWYSQNGIITIAVDHRGSGQFGKLGLDYLYRSLGKWEILDYADAVAWLRTKPFVDDDRIGITGTSYGGYLTCLALTKGADYWTHGVAGMPVTDFRLYDNIYTERYMDTPEENPDGYKDGSALTYADRLKGKLYIYHADMDDNVHLQNSIYLISKLQDEGKSFRFMLYPNGRHGWGGEKAFHSRNEANNFWIENFFGK